MEDNLYISKTRTLNDSENYALLREEGLKYIESLASKLWTDYNTHDPGITTMEALCYAITELGYRANFDIKDLLTNEDGFIINQEAANRDDAFFTAREILTNRPLTVEDYRKLLIDISGVHNAWIFPEKSVTIDEGETAPTRPTTEVEFYPCCEEDRLVYNKTHHKAIDVRGLYNTLLDLDTTIEYGDLNNGHVFYTFTENRLRGITLEAYLDNWKSKDSKILKVIQTGVFKVTAVTYDVKKSEFRITLNYDTGFTKEFTYFIGYTLKPNLENIDNLIQTELKEKKIHIAIAKLYIAKNDHIRGIIKEVHQVINDNRNLGEDCISIDTVSATEIGFCADIEVKPEIDIEQVLAEVYYTIENYFNPTVTFYLLSELIAKGLTTDAIFEGTKLNHGFIDTEELKAAALRSEIRVSDLINSMMDIEGVTAVKNVLLTAYNDDGTPISPSQRWCVKLDKYRKPLLNINKSKVLFFKDRLPFKAKYSETMEILNNLRGVKERPKLRGHQNDLEIPEGTYYNLSDYYTVQYEFPQTYGISSFGLPDTASDERKAQAKQLRAYLMFFDQAMADFFAQLSNSKKLFSLNEDISQTYFSNYISEVKDIDEIYLGTNLKNVQEAASFGNLENEVAHQYLIEDEEMFYKRRNKFLDHLMARFSESFNDYVLMMYTLDGVKSDNAALIHDKIKFINDYPTISSERGKTFNYLKPCWVSDGLSHTERAKRTQNVSGLEKRIARFAGIEDYSQRNLFCLPDISTTQIGKNYFFYLKDGTTTYLTNYELKDYNSEEKIEDLINKVYDYFLSKRNYIIEEKSASKFFVRLRDDSNCIIASSPSFFTSEANAKAHIATILVKFAAKCDAEGMHLIEHILLRPRFKVNDEGEKKAEEIYRLMQVCLNKDCDFCGEQDPYSFRLTVLLPYWNKRFRNMNFRRYFEKMIRTEAPAHLSLKICWINFTSMKKFETIFKKWLEALQDYESDIIANEMKKNALMNANNEMVVFLANINSEYPQALLHDCDEGMTNPVMLGSTALGGY